MMFFDCKLSHATYEDYIGDLKSSQLKVKLKHETEKPHSTNKMSIGASANPKETNCRVRNEEKMMGIIARIDKLCLIEFGLPFETVILAGLAILFMAISIWLEKHCSG